MHNCAILISGTGSNMKTIIHEASHFPESVKISLVISDRASAAGVEFAKKSGIETAVVERKEFPSRYEFEVEVIELLQSRKIDYILLAGFMRVLSPEFVSHFPDRIFNIHPSLLPAFKGGHAVEDALKYGVKVTGATLHIVNEEVDGGKILYQTPVEVVEGEAKEELHERIKREEHKLYRKLVRDVANSKYK